ncbi:hypothetical protein [Paenibacillus xylanilyticus]
MELEKQQQKMYVSAIDAESIARAIAFAIEQPADVAINEMVIVLRVRNGI